ncbi:UNVERIFIED_CONTAM: hypothetical protein PYX00_010283 [Menopon gallinae]|uniref:Uncharacterized protein n=1 Tax=Menopon gallinae TaxID=328185 RepID=A0AAW2HEH9_9NEOP
MWKISIFAVLLVCSLSAANGKELPICKRLGPQCSPDRKLVVVCAELNKPAKLMTDCSEKGKSCSEKGGEVKCVDGNPGEDEKVNFKCTDKGEFPDPVDCTVTYKCGEKPYPQEKCVCAAGGFIYPDLNSNLPCYDLPECPREEIVCSDGKNGELRVNDMGTGICYLCQGNDTYTAFKCSGQLSPSLRLSEVKKTCQPLSEVPGTSPKPTDPTPTSTTTTPKPRPPGCDPPKCTDPRCGTVWRYTAECDCYFWQCDRRMVPEKRTCPFKTHYNHLLQRCVPGLCDRNCPSCD